MKSFTQKINEYFGLGLSLNDIVLLKKVVGCDGLFYIVLSPYELIYNGLRGFCKLETVDDITHISDYMIAPVFYYTNICEHVKHGECFKDNSKHWFCTISNHIHKLSSIHRVNLHERHGELTIESYNGNHINRGDIIAILEVDIDPFKITRWGVDEYMRKHKLK